MSVFYTMAYWMGFTPWEKAATHPAAARQIVDLFEREERERQPPYGSALDLGCGRGHWSIVLAQRGWRVTGVDLVARAVSAARARAREAGVKVRLVQRDVTTLREASVDADFRLVWDFGTMHGLTPAQRAAVGRGINALTAADASILMMAWAPGQRGPLPRGASRREIEEAYSGWKVVDEELFDASGLPKPLRKVEPRVYRLRRA